MQDNIGIVIAMILIVTLIIIFPIYNLFERQDDMTYTLALKATTSFVDKVRGTGYIDQQSYDDFVTELATTGIAYDIEIEAHIKTLVEDVDNPGEYFVQYKIDYNEDIFEDVADNVSSTSALIKDGAYLFNDEDQIYVKLKNSNQTAAEVVFNAIIPTVSTTKIEVNYGGIITNTSWEKVDSTVYSFSTAPTKPDVIKTNGTVISEATVYRVENGQTVTLTSISNASDWFKSVDSYTWQIIQPDGTYEELLVTSDSNQESSITKKIVNDTDQNITVMVYATDSYGEDSLVTKFYIATYDVVPTTPILTSTPDTIGSNVISPTTGGTSITFRASSTVDSTWKEIDYYVYEITNGGTTEIEKSTTGTLTYIFQQGVASVKVYAVDTDGKQSTATGTAFSIMNNFSQAAITGVGIARIESIPIDGAYVVGYTFKVVISSGHSGSDWWKITGVKEDGTTEQIDYLGVRNGVDTEGIISVDKQYSYLIFEYSVDSGHASCLSDNSAISYSVDYKFL